MMSENRYLKDESVNEKYYDDGLVSPKDLITGSAVLAGSALAFKKGLLKPIVKEAMELSSETKPLLPVLFNDVRRWLKSDGLSPEANKNSLFRMEMKSLISNIVSQDKEVASNILKSTKEDFGMFKKIFNSSIDELEKGMDNYEVINNYTNTSLINNIKLGTQEVEKYSDTHMLSKRTMKSKVFDTVLKNFSKTDEELANQLKTTGYRQVTLDDMFETLYNKEGKVYLREKTKFDFSKVGDKGDRVAPKKRIEALLNYDLISDDGIKLSREGRTARMTDRHNLKNITLDDSLLIDEADNIIDLRARKRENLKAIRNLSTEWKIPVIGVNPLGMLGLNKVGRPKTKFGTIKENMVAPALTGKYGNTVENTIANVKKFDDRLKDVKDGVTIIDGDVFTMGESGAIKKLDFKYKKDLVLVPKSKAHNSRGLTHIENAQRKMMGITNKHYKDYTEADGNKYIAQKIAKAFDIGRQEKDIDKDTIDNIVGLASPDNLVEKALSKVGLKIKPYKEVVENKNFTEMMTPGGRLPKDDTFMVVNRSIGLKDIKVNNFNKDIIKDYGKQYIADFKKDQELVNNKTGILHFIMERMNQSISSVGLGLSLESNTGPVSSATNLITKRFLPVYGAYQGWNALNAFTEGEDENGQRTSINRSIMENVASTDVGLSHIRDKLGITKFAKRITELTPGYDQIEELPVVNSMNLHESAEERKEYWEDGKDAVRRNRYWGLNTSSSFTGKNIAYFKLNPLNAAKSDAKFSDSQFGSRKEYFSNMLDPYYYDKKHYKDRPYLLTSPAFENIPIVGDTLSSTVGKFLKPQVKMHKEYWDGDNPKTSEQIIGDQAILNVEQQRRVSAEMSKILAGNANMYAQAVYSKKSDNSIEIKTELAKQKAKEIIDATNIDSNTDLSSEEILIDSIEANQKPNSYIPSKSIDVSKQEPLPSEITPSSQSIGDTTLIFDNGTNLNNDVDLDQSGRTFGAKSNISKMIRFDNEYDLSNQNMLYRTGSGKINVINTGEEKDPLIAVNKNNESPNSFIGNNERGYSVTNNYLISPNELNKLKEQDIENPNSISSTIRNQLTDTANVAGIYGFAFNSAFAGDTLQKGRTVIETSGWSRSFNKTFWDEELGGFGGDISEIFRRLVQDRTTNGVNYYNPIRNTMPDWMPGQGAFTDFQHGDPYSKIARGEERLPGEGFERAYGINVNDYSIDSKELGKSKEELIAKFLKKDEFTEEDRQKESRKINRVQEQYKNYLINNDIALDYDQTIYDTKNNIGGTYDVKMKDDSSKTGEAIVEVRAVNDDAFKEIEKSNMVREEDMKQVNFFLHNTNKKNNGGVLYVNNDDTTQMRMTKFKYSEEMYDESIKNVQDARFEVQNAINSGQISRAERYDPIDKLRILADVSPYSQEYSDMTKYVRSLDLNDEQKKEIQKIEDMVSQQRKQLRTYDYRFKTADVIKEKVNISSQIEDDKFMTDGFDNPIKLAGLDLPSKTNDEELHSKAMEFINKNVNGKVEIKIAKDEHLRTNKDNLKTMNAVVYANGMNINRELIKRGLAEEKENDYTAAGVHARFNSLERNFGSAWETVAHQNTIINNRILRVRSAKEDYERQQVYGKDFKSWTSPLQDFIKPMIWSAMADETTSDRIVGAGLGLATGAFLGSGVNTPKGRMMGAAIGLTAGGTTGTSLLGGAFIGSLFGSSNSRFGKLIGASVGASFVGAAKSYKIGYEAATGEKWIPKEKRRENEVIEYLDKLEFIKNKRLYEVYSKKALLEDGIDVKNLITESEEDAKKNKKWGRKIEDIKREQKKSGKFNIKEYEEEGLEFDKVDKKHHLVRSKRDLSSIKEKQEIDNKKESLKDAKRVSKTNSEKKKIKEKEKQIKSETKEYIEHSKKRKKRALEKTVNENINNAKTTKQMMTTSQNAMKAIEFYNKSEETMYGYNPGENISAFTKALPKKDRKYFNEFLKAGEKERKEILEIAPKYMRRALQNSYGMKVDEKDNLVDYFSEHYLPDEHWDGWQESYDFDAIRTKVISREGFNLASHDIWEDDKLKADMYGSTPVPNIDNRTKDIQAVKSQLESVLGSAGFEDIDVSFSTGHNNASINLDIYEEKKQKFEQKIRERVGMY